MNRKPNKNLLISFWNLSHYLTKLPGYGLSELLRVLLFQMATQEDEVKSWPSQRRERRDIFLKTVIRVSGSGRHWQGCIELYILNVPQIKNNEKRKSRKRNTLLFRDKRKACVWWGYDSIWPSDTEFRQTINPAWVCHARTPWRAWPVRFTDSIIFTAELRLISHVLVLYFFAQRIRFPFQS